MSGINEKKKFRDITTLSGENFVDFHHRILDAHCDLELFDASEWLRKKGGTAKAHYKYVIALHAIRNVLFENMEGGREDTFFNEVFFPAVEFVMNEFSLKPLIMPIAPQDDMDNKYWWCYPENVKNMVE